MNSIGLISLGENGPSPSTDRPSPSVALSLNGVPDGRVTERAAMIFHFLLKRGIGLQKLYACWQCLARFRTKPGQSVFISADTISVITQQKATFVLE